MKKWLPILLSQPDNTSNTNTTERFRSSARGRKRQEGPRQHGHQKQYCIMEIPPFWCHLSSKLMNEHDLRSRGSILRGCLFYCSADALWIWVRLKGLEKLYGEVKTAGGPRQKGRQTDEVEIPPTVVPCCRSEWKITHSINDRKRGILVRSFIVTLMYAEYGFDWKILRSSMGEGKRKKEFLVIKGPTNNDVERPPNADRKMPADLEKNNKGTWTCAFRKRQMTVSSCDLWVRNVSTNMRKKESPSRSPF